MSQSISRSPWGGALTLTVIVFSCLTPCLCFCIFSLLWLNLLFRTQGRPRRLKPSYVQEVWDPEGVCAWSPHRVPLSLMVMGSKTVLLRCWCFPVLICRFNAISSKTTQFLKRLWQDDSKIYKEIQGTKEIPNNNKKEVKRLTLPDSKSYKAIADKTEQCWLKDRQINQRTRLEFRTQSLHLWQEGFNKGAEAI